MSKGLKALKLLGEMPKALSIGCETTLKVFCAKEFNIIEKELKALEIIKDIWGDRILTDIEKGFVLGSPYIKLPSNEKCDLLKEVLL